MADNELVQAMTQPATGSGGVVVTEEQRNQADLASAESSDVGYPARIVENECIRSAKHVYAELLATREALEKLRMAAKDLLNEFPNATCADSCEEGCPFRALRKLLEGE